MDDNLWHTSCGKCASLPPTAPPTNAIEWWPGNETVCLVEAWERCCVNLSFSWGLGMMLCQSELQLRSGNDAVSIWASVEAWEWDCVFSWGLGMMHCQVNLSLNWSLGMRLCVYLRPGNDAVSIWASAEAWEWCCVNLSFSWSLGMMQCQSELQLKPGNEACFVGCNIHKNCLIWFVWCLVDL